MKVTSKELVQSYVLTTAKYDFSVYEKRILYRLIELAQADIQGKKLDRMYIVGETLFKDKIITMPLRAFMKDEKDRNYSEVKKALENLRNKTIEYDDGNLWQLIGIIEKPKFERNSGMATFEIQPMIWDAILNFSKGFSKYELQTAMSFDSIYTMRFYELFSNNKNPLTFTIEQLKERFKIADKYKNKPTNFIKYVVQKAKEELDKKSPYSFEFTPLKTGRKITAIKFYPYEIPANKTDEIEKKKAVMQMSSSWIIPYEVTRYLKQKYGFDEKGIRANIELFKKAYKEFDLLKFLAEIHHSAQKAKNKQAYAIGAIRNYLANLEKGKEWE